MATCSPHVLPAQKMKVIRPRLIAQSRSIPPISHSTLRTIGPWTTAAKADPMRRNPTTLLTPEQADTTLRGNDTPWCTTTNSVPSGEVTDFATGKTLTISRDAHQRGRGEGVEDLEQHGRVRVGPPEEEVPDGELLAPQHPHAEDDGHGPGDEDRQGEEVDPPHPEHGRHLAGQQQVGGQGATDQRQADDVVDLPVVDGRLGTYRTGPHRRQGQGDRRHQADVGERRLEAGVLDRASRASSCRPPPPRPAAPPSGWSSAPAPVLRANGAAPGSSTDSRWSARVWVPTGSKRTTWVIRTDRGRSRRYEGPGGRRRRCSVGPASTMCPGWPSPSRRKSAHWSETRWACCMLWVTMTMVTSRRSSLIVSSMTPVDIGSRAEHGSSMSRTRGRTARARAMHRRCC